MLFVVKDKFDENYKSHVNEIYKTNDGRVAVMEFGTDRKFFVREDQIVPAKDWDEDDHS